MLCLVFVKVLGVWFALKGDGRFLQCQPSLQVWTRVSHDQVHVRLRIESFCSKKRFYATRLNDSKSCGIRKWQNKKLIVSTFTKRSHLNRRQRRSATVLSYGAFVLFLPARSWSIHRPFARQAWFSEGQQQTLAWTLCSLFLVLNSWSYNIQKIMANDPIFLFRILAFEANVLYVGRCKSVDLFTQWVQGDIYRIKTIVRADWNVN